MLMTRLVHRIRKKYVKFFIIRFIRNLHDEKLIQKILSTVLKARGYNNYENFTVSGEKYFVDIVLAKNQPKICVDVGANVGSYSSLLLETYEDAMIYAFEPLPSPYERLSSVKEKFGERLIAINKGVGNKIETLRIHFNEVDTAHASLSKEIGNISYINNELCADVEVITLDSYFTNDATIETIDFIKIDTEGFEFEVLCGAKETISTYRPKIIQMEFNWHQLFKARTLLAFSQFLSDYEVFQMLPDRLVRRDPKDIYANIYDFSNFAFIRSDIVPLIEKTTL